MEPRELKPARVDVRSRPRRRWPYVTAASVVALVAVGATLVVQYRYTVRQSQEQVLKTDLFRLRAAIGQYEVDKHRYPASLDALVAEGYLRRLPEDPFTRSSRTWETVPAPAVPGAAGGVYDVKSGAAGTALDGTKYRDW